MGGGALLGGYLAQRASCGQDGFCGLGVAQDGQGEDESADSGCVNDVWWSEDGREWHEVEGTPWPARHAASVWVHQGSLWMAAGSRTDISNGCRSDVWRLRKEASL